MIGMTWVDDVFKAAGILYWLLALGALALALRYSKGRLGKGISAVVVAAVFGYLPVTGMIETKKRNDFRQEAFAHWQKRCKENAGIKIYKTAKDVESVLITKPRPVATEVEIASQFWKGDQYAGIDYFDPGISTVAEHVWPQSPVGGSPSIVPTPLVGYPFVELLFKSTSSETVVKQYRANFSTKKLDVQEVPNPVSRYTVEWEDVSTAEDQQHWVSASHWRILDGASGEVMGERRGYLIEHGFGNRSGGRAPWVHARMHSLENACPSFKFNSRTINREFLQSVLSPKGK